MGGWLGGWVGGATGEMKNKAKLGLNLVLAGALAELGNPYNVDSSCNF